MSNNTRLEVGCVFDGVLGVSTTIQRICQFALDLGWDGRVPTDEDQSDSEEVFGLEDEATEWLNEHIAEEGFTFGWHDGSYFYWSHDEWNQLV